MKRWILALFYIAFSSAAVVSAHSQVVPAATERVLTVRAGALASAFQPDYAGEGIAQTSPNRLYGIAAFADVHVSRWIQPEFEARWLDFNEYLSINENSYSIGDRVPIVMDFHRFQPYGKVLVGLGTGSFLTGNSFVLTYGGGTDYRLTRKFNARVDFEYQQWHVTPTLYPYGLSAGISYRVF
jgi:hypothetical protein